MILVFAWFGSRSISVLVGTLISFLTIGYFGMWEDTMSTLAIILVATFLCISIGIPMGIAMARSNKVQALVVPVLDIMQTIPSFVYLIPVVMLAWYWKSAWFNCCLYLCYSSNSTFN